MEWVKIRVLQDQSCKNSRCKPVDQKIGGVTVTRAGYVRGHPVSGKKEEGSTGVLRSQTISQHGTTHESIRKMCLPASPSSHLPLHPTTTRNTDITKRGQVSVVDDLRWRWLPSSARRDCTTVGAKIHSMLGEWTEPGEGGGGGAWETRKDSTRSR